MSRLLERLSTKLKERKGFTLMEMIIVIGIVAILSAIITVGIRGYMISAYMTRVNDTAKTVFLASQNYITEQKQLGKLDEFNQMALSYGNSLSSGEIENILLKNNEGNPDFNLEEYRATYRTDNIRYILLNAGEAAAGSSNPLDVIVRTYMNDTDLLEHTFLMEYDTKTGVVRAVFYTEQADSFSYDGAETDKSNVIIRNDKEALRAKRQGYYGVETTSLVKNDIELWEPKEVLLVNGERLYLQWQESNYASPAERLDVNYKGTENVDFVAITGLEDYLVYDVAVCRKTEGEGNAEEEVLFTVNGLKAAQAQGTTLAEADAVIGAIENPVRFTYDSNTNTYQLLLDDIDHSIYDTYTLGKAADDKVTVTRDVVAEDTLFCTVCVRIEGNDDYDGESNRSNSNVQSANYAGGVDEVVFYRGTTMEKTVTAGGNGNLNEDGAKKDAADEHHPFSVATARHLHNMRYAKANSYFVQTADIDWKKPETDMPVSAKEFEPLTFKAVGAVENFVEDTVFSGNFQNGCEEGDDFVISNLTIEKLSGTQPEKKVGLFRENAGVIEGIHLKKASVKGAYLTGVVCGSNSGTIKKVTIENSEAEAAYYLGGITGYNQTTGIIEEVKAGVRITGALHTDSPILWEAVNAEEEVTPECGWYIGGIAGVNNGKIEKTDFDSVTAGTKTISGVYCVGGITGCNLGSLQNVSVRAEKIEASCYVGGITGYNKKDAKIFSGSVKTVETSVSGMDAPTGVSFTGKEMESGESLAAGWYIGGVAGVNRGEISNMETGSKTVTGISNVGGIAGANFAKEGSILGVFPTTEGGKITDVVNNNELKTLKKTDGSHYGQAVSGGGTGVPAVYQNFGGIVGRNGEAAVVEKCEVKTLIFLEKNETDPEYVENIGGITGRNAGDVKACFYRESENQTTSVQEMIQECFAGIEKTKEQGGGVPVYSGLNVGGIAGWNEETGLIAACGCENGITGHRNVGGIAGKNQGTLSYRDGIFTNVSVEDRKIRGLVAATTDSAGGVTGTNEQQTITEYKNYATIFASSLAGGITGNNGGIGDYSFTREREAAGYYNELLQPGFEALNTGMKIQSCENYGFVYAYERYAGGIAGINYGIIHASNSVVKLEEVDYLKDKLADETYMDSIANADCVGGIAGANFGKIQGNSTVATIHSGILGYDFVGGVAGLNCGAITSIQKVEGRVWANGIGAGGIAGLNTSAEALNNIAFTEGMEVRGGYFVGGIIGLNIAQGDADTEISLLVTRIDEETGNSGVVKGTAYVGGILGYNTRLHNGQDMAGLFAGEIKPLENSAFDEYERKSGGTDTTEGATIFRGCQNHAEVYAKRYLGGIVGYNGEKSPLYIIDSLNYGKIEVVKENNDTDDGYYFVGGITGRNSKSGIIHKCINDGSVISPSKYLGGICEVNEGYVQFCTIGKDENYSEKGITGEHSVGGLVGLNSNYVVQCVSSTYAKVQGGNNTGGIAGTNDEKGIITGDGSKAKKIPGVIEDRRGSSDVTACISSGTIIGKDCTGGIAGLNKGQIELVSLGNTATIAGYEYVGGFIGDNQGVIGTADDDATIISDLESHAKRVIGRNEVGGIVGRHNATKIINCKNYSEVQIETSYAGNAGGITGSIADGISIEECENYGIVTGHKNGCKVGGITGENKGIVLDCVHFGMAESDYSTAGGIAGDNFGTVKKSVNYGSVAGAVTVNELAAIGGITGINESAGRIEECASKNVNEAVGKGYLGTPESNQIAGCHVVGGLIGHNKGLLSNTESDTRLVTVPIRTKEVSLNKSRIGGIIGRDSSGAERLKDYTFAGTIEVTRNGSSENQCVGGIIGETEQIRGKAITLENCLFDGTISGYGNKENTAVSSGGVGGLVGVSQGTIIVYRNENGFYSAVTERALVEGGMNVGGLAGSTSAGHEVLVKETAGSTEQPLSVDKYYTNLAKVSGGVRVGGCYGSMKFYGKGNSGKNPFRYHRNGYDGAPAGVANVRGDAKFTTVQALGGIVGSAYQTGVTDISDLYNYGTIGSLNDASYVAVGKNIGGIIGSYEKGTRQEISKIYNYGRISLGVENVGGLIGSINVPSSTNLASVHDCGNYGAIVSKAKVTGGLLGYARRLEVTAVENRGAITLLDVKRVASLTGGIIGDGGQIQVTGITNYGTITDKRSVRYEYAEIGGIVGRINSYTGSDSISDTITGCTNEGVIYAPNAGRVGGIAGWIASNTKAEISSCTNKANLTAQESLGGIIGETAGQRVALIENNSNEGTLAGKYRIGGIIGKLNINAGASADNLIYRDCTNYGDIYPNTTGDSYNEQVHEIGGCIGYFKSGTTVQNFVNEGNILLTETRTSGTKNATLIHDIGGIAGLIGDSGRSDHAPDLLACTNKGTVRLEQITRSNIQLYNIGGIVGSIKSDGALVEACVNETDLDLSNDIRNRNTTDWNWYYKNYARAQKQDYNIGGIAGLVEEDAKLRYCTNKGSVKTSMNIGSNVGGVAGESRGLIYSCKTENTSGTAIVSGKEAVGGIVGFANGITCKLVSVADANNADMDLMINTLAVNGEKMVGGVAGRVQSATIQSAVNVADVTRTNWSDKVRPENAAGGIAGFAKKEGQQGVLVNCYNFGEVHFVSGEEFYLGGVVGYRDHGKDEFSTGSNEKTALAVKDSFYFKDRTGTSIPYQRPSQTLAIGNEPENGYWQDSNDQMFGFAGTGTAELLTEERFHWTEEAYKQMYQCVQGSAPGSTAGWDNLNTVIGNVIKKYNQYKLPVPETSGVTAGEEYNYTLHITKMPGFCEEIQMFLFDSNCTDFKEENAIYSTGRLPVTMDGQLYDIPFNVKEIADYENYVGKPLQVGLIAYGSEEETENGNIIYTVQSDLGNVCDFIVMPPLLIPQIEEVRQDGPQVTFRITNWEEYQKSAAEIYNTLPAALQNLEVYKKLVNGLAHFEIKDNFNQKENQTGSSISHTWEIEADKIADDGTFTLDYSTLDIFNANRSTHQYHYWEVKAIAKNSDGSVMREVVESNSSYYRYTTSLSGNHSFRIQAEVPLNPPTDLKAEYVGGIDWEKDADTPSYTISFTASTSPEEAIDHYLVTVTNPANGKKWQETVAVTELQEVIDIDTGELLGKTGSLTIPKEVMLGDGEGQLAVNLAPEEEPLKLNYTIQAIKNDSDAAKYFMDSEEASAEISLIKKGYPVDTISRSVENPNEPDKWTYKWTDSWADGKGLPNEIYLVTLRIQDADTGAVTVKDSIETTDRYYVVDTTSIKESDTIEVSVVRKGIGTKENKNVTRLNSDPSVHSMQKGSALPKVSNITTTFDRVEGSDLVYKVDFTVPAELTAEDCSGFVLQQINANDTNELLGEKVTIAYDEARPVEIRIPFSGNEGKTFRTGVSAVSKNDIYSDSAMEQGISVTIPSNKLAAPTALKVTVGGKELAESSIVSLLDSEFASAAYELSWTLSGSSDIKQQIVELVSVDGGGSETIVWSETTASSTTQSLATVDLSAYAGQMLTMRVANIPVDASVSLPSDAATLRLAVPKKRLQAPTIGEITAALDVDTDTYTLQVPWIAAVAEPAGSVNIKIVSVERVNDTETETTVLEKSGEPITATGTGTITITDIPKENAGKQMKIYLSFGVKTEEAAVWTDSDENTKEFSIQEPNTTGTANNNSMMTSSAQRNAIPSVPMREEENDTEEEKDTEEKDTEE